MKLVRALAVGAVAATFAVGCSDNDGTGSNGVTVEDLVGTWTATKLEFTNQANTDQHFDIISGALGSLTITVTSNGSFSGTFAQCGLPSLCPEQDAAGTIALSGNTGTLTFTAPAEFDEPISGTFTLTTGDPDVLTLNATSGLEFDFSIIGGDPGEVPANLELVMER